MPLKVRHSQILQMHWGNPAHLNNVLCKGLGIRAHGLCLAICAAVLMHRSAYSKRPCALSSRTMAAMQGLAYVSAGSGEPLLTVKASSNE